MLRKKLVALVEGWQFCDQKSTYGFIFYYLKTQKHRWDAFSSEGTVFGSLRRQDLAQMEVPIPEDVFTMNLTI
jgi:restriction endonuclease S subunit